MAMPVSATKPRLQAIMTRFTEIRDIDSTNLTTSKRKDLKKEVKIMKKEVNETSLQRSIFISSCNNHYYTVTYFDFIIFRKISI
jgi:hypothetical protein